ALDTQDAVTQSPGVDWSGRRTEPPRAEIGSIAQGFGTSRVGATDNVKAQTSDPENATLAAIKALHEEVKALETRIATQDARIAIARPIASCCCWPPDKSPPRRPSMSFSTGNISKMNDGTPADFFCVASPISRFSPTVKRGKISRPCGT